MSYSTESSKRTEKVNLEKFVRYHELIHLKNLKHIFDYPTNKEEINTRGIKGSKYEKSSTPNSTEVNHGKEDLKRGVY